MACACKVNQEIDKIHKYYSRNGKTAREEKPRLGINGKDAVITLFIYLLLLPLIPFMVIFVIVRALSGKGRMISMKRFLGFIHTVRHGKQQQIV